MTGIKDTSFPLVGETAVANSGLIRCRNNYAVERLVSILYAH